MNSVLPTLGGLGLFLFGMAVMTSGLRALAGERLHAWLARRTRTPLSGALTGTAVTAIVQSSSATTVAAVGFVGAGLIPFANAVGIIFGANIGTTLTGWMIALVGFKLSLGTAALPVLFVASLLYLAKTKPRTRAAGKALAGFALIFLGIAYLQDGLASHQGSFDLSAFSSGTLPGRLLLVAVGAALAIVTQSSSATVATTLTALNTGVLDLPQAAAVIIGADVGTTATAALATVGGNTASRRTGFAHVIYNLLTGLAAFFSLPAYLWAVDRLAPGTATASPEVVAVGFHTTFNAIGVVLALPFARPFARLIERMFPERSPTLTRALDRHLLSDAATAADTLAATTRKVAGATLRHAAHTLSGTPPDHDRPELSEAVTALRTFALRAAAVVPNVPGRPSPITAALHVLDHTERLVDRCADVPRATTARTHPTLGTTAGTAAALLASESPPAAELSDLAAALEADRAGSRQKLIAAATATPTGANDLDAALDAHRWLRRSVHNAARIAHHLTALPGAGPTNAGPTN